MQSSRPVKSAARPDSARSASNLPGQAGPGVFPIDPSDLIVGLGRGLAIIESFGDEFPSMTVSKVSQRTGIPRTAVRRHLLSLCHFGYALTDGKTFWLAPRILRLGQSYLGAAKFPRQVQPFIQRLSIATGETVNVSVLDGHEVVYLARSNSPRFVSIGFHPGARAPAHVVSPGVVLLSRLPEVALRQWVKAHDFGRFTAHTITDREEFARNVRQVRKEDYCLLRQKLDSGLMGVAVPLVDRHGQCKAALGMTVQVSAWSEQAVREMLVPLLKETAISLMPLL